MTKEEKYHIEKAEVLKHSQETQGLLRKAAEDRCSGAAHPSSHRQVRHLAWSSARPGRGSMNTRCSHSPLTCAPVRPLQRRQRDI